MAYITNADVALRLGPALYVQLTDDAGTGSANETLATAVREQAEGEVDSYLGRRFAVPVDLTLHPELRGLLAGVALDVTVYRLYARRPPVPEDVTAAGAAARAWLAGAAAGQIALPAASPPATATNAGPTAAVCGNEAVLNRRDLAGC